MPLQPVHNYVMSSSPVVLGRREKDDRAWWRERTVLTFETLGQAITLSLPIYQETAVEQYLRRFWSKVLVPDIEQDTCWRWQGHCDREGYGQFRITYGVKQYKVVRSPRWVYSIMRRPLYRHELVCHTCDNPPCVRLDHLWVGDDAANTRDMLQKGRAAWQKEPV